MDNVKIDFRKGNSASRRTIEAKRAIREALAQGSLTFGGILRRTGLSKRGLSRNLDELSKEGEIRRWKDTKDRRKIFYALTERGWKKYRQQKVLEILRRAESTSLGDIIDVIIENVANAIIAAAEITKFEQRRRLWEDAILPKLTKYEVAVFDGCLEGRVYACIRKNEIVSYFDALKEFLTAIKLVAAKKDIDIEFLRGLPEIHFEFKFSKNKLIEIYKLIKEKNLEK